MKQVVIDKEAKEVGTMELSDSVFAAAVHKGSIYEVVKNQLANKRQGTSSTKTRGMVRGSTKKPWRQKGTGRARAGSKKSPLWRGKGIIFGPHPRDFSYVIPKRVRRKALFSVFSQFRSEDRLKLVEKIDLETFKTKELCGVLRQLTASHRVILLIDSGEQEASRKIRRAANNIPWVKVVDVNAIEIKDLYYAEELLLMRGAAEVLNKRYEKAKHESQ